MCKPSRLVVLLCCLGAVIASATATAQPAPQLSAYVQTPNVEPFQVFRGGVQVYGVNPPYVVTIDTRAIGGSEFVRIAPSNGLCGELASTYNVCYTIPSSIAPGPKTMPIRVVDGLGRVATATMALKVSAPLDTDGDDLPDAWERHHGLRDLDPAGENGATGDPDRDGLTNLEELQRGSHPRGFFTKYLAEGATIGVFSTQFAVANIGPQSARVLVRFLPRDGRPVLHGMNVRAFTRTTIEAAEVPGVQQQEFATVVEADVDVVVERTMRWDTTGYGTHAEMATSHPSTTWYLAEGATHSGMELFYLLQNPKESDAEVRVSYLLQNGRLPVVEQIKVPAQSRQTIWVNQVAGLGAVDVSAKIESTNDVPIIVERSLYLSTPGLEWAAGTDSLGIVSTSDRWFFAEGTTGEMFDLFLLIANPGPNSGSVAVSYLFDDGRVIERVYPAAAQSRQTIWVDREDDRLAAAAVSMVVTGLGGLQIVAERSMWWPGPSSTRWTEAHNAPGATRTAHAWALAEGEVRDAPRTDTYVLIANTSAFAGRATVTLLKEGAEIERQLLPLPASSRVTVDIRSSFPLAANRRFSIVVESLPSEATPPAEIVVERAMYSSDGRPPSFTPYWPAGTSAMGQPLGIDASYELTLSSEPGDWVGGGLPPRYFITGTGEFLLMGTPSPAVSPLRFKYTNGNSVWLLMFGGTDGTRLIEGTYDSASQAGAPVPSQSFLEVDGEGRGCPASTGRFVVREAQYDQAGALVRFHAEFEQHCDPGAPALRGTIRVGY